jgi:hypothetical protein
MNKIKYSKLNARQQESYNYQKISGILADYGYTTIKLDDDWESADFIAKHVNEDNFLKVQLKSRLSIQKKYIGKNLYICFRRENYCYLYPHDKLINELSKIHPFKTSKSWKEKGSYNFPSISKKIVKLLDDYKLTA